MTDKEIIIDGVDVAGCKYFNRFRSICHNKNLCCDCEKNQDCYYKQLKRKEQECEELKSESFTREELIGIQEKDIDRYRKALEEIEKYTREQFCDNCEYQEYFDIIAKAKDGK
jgi:hypothetical protein